MTSILNIIYELNADNGSKYKSNVLSSHKDNELLKRILKMTYDKVAFTYGVSVKHWHGVDLSGHPVTMTLEQALDVLEHELAPRNVTGHAALDRVTEVLHGLDEGDRNVVLRVINRDLRINMGRTIINKIIPGLIIKPVYMRCDAYSAKNSKKINPKGSFIQLKADGTYREFQVSEGVVTSRSRSGEDYDYPILFEEMKDLPDGHYFGELTVVRDGKALPRAEGNGMMNSDNPPHEEIVFDAWDYVTPEEYQKASANKKFRGSTPYAERFAKLGEIVAGLDHVKVIESHRVDSAKEALVHVMRWMNDGLEGGVWKDADGRFFDGTSGQQQKMKLVISLEVRVTGYQEGTPGTVREKTFGALTFETDDGKIKGRCAGLNNAMLEEINSRRDHYLGKVFEVECNDITKGRDNDFFALSHPRFIEFRVDKDTTDTLESAMAQKEMAMDIA